MSALATLSCALNVSEGRRGEVVESIAHAAGRHARLLDVSPDPDHNRSVVTICGAADPLLESVLALSAVAVQKIDLRGHQGVHPRLGAVDVVPFTPAAEATMEDAVVLARRCAERLWEELAIPSFLYERAATTPEWGRLPDIRRNAFKSRFPDVGDRAPHPTAGAAVVGARDPLVAFNVNLATGDVGEAIAIAAEIRSGERSLPSVRTLGLMLPTRGVAQVSMNITQPDLCTVYQAFARVRELALERGLEIDSSEVVGVIREGYLGTVDASELKLVENPKFFDLICKSRVAGAR